MACPPDRPTYTLKRVWLSEEDQALVKELALLEQLELVKNLELFESDRDAGKPPDPPQRQP